ncbi:MAG: CD3072 family TudS-related putative desulfidase [Candidatus Bathyarchaeia archaeon]
MISDGRSGKLIVLAHCILNTNSICRGPKTPSLWPGMINPIVEKIMEYNVGVFQLPCPEFVAYGLDRPAMSREDLECLGFRSKCREIASSVSAHLKEYSGKGYKLIALVGLRGSPSCSPGLDGREKGIFFEELEEALKAHDINLPMIDFERTEAYKCMENLEEILSSS